MNQPGFSYAGLVKELGDRASIQGTPLSGTFELTNRCNLSCGMCYVRQPTQGKEAGTGELTASEWLSVARQAVDNGMVFLSLTGGEVLLRRDFFDIYEPMTCLGCIITLYTNATLVSEEVAARLANAPPSRVFVSLYGATPEVYDRVTQVSGSYDQCRSGIQALLSRGIPLQLMATITRENVAEVSAMRQIASDLGLHFDSGWLLSARTDGSHSEVKACRLSVGDCLALENTELDAEAMRSVLATRRQRVERNTVFSCSAGRIGFYISSLGAMNACWGLALPAEFPLERGFAAAWSNVRRFVDEAPSLSPTCATCTDRIYCDICPASSYTETGTLNKPVQYLCAIARARRCRHEDL